IQTGAKAIEAARKDKEATRQAAKLTEAGRLKEKIATFLAQREPHGALAEEIRDAVGNKNKVGPLLAEMLQSLEIVRSRKAGDKVNAKRWRKPPALATNAQQEQRLRTGEPVEAVIPGLG